MIWDASYKPEFNENEIKFVDSLLELLKDNRLIDITDEQLRAKAVQVGVPEDEVDSLLKKLKECQALTRLVHNNLQIHPHQLKALKHSIEQRTCPKCKNQTLKERQVKYCQCCGKVIGLEDIEHKQCDKAGEVATDEPDIEFTVETNG